MPKPKSKVNSVIKEWVESIVIALLLAVVIRVYFIQPFKIPSGSMRPTLLEDNQYDIFGLKLVIGDHIFVSMLRYGPILLPEIHSPDFLQKYGDIQWPKFLEPLEKIRLPGFGKPQRGDVIVFIYPGDRTKDFIKRLIGLPGDIVEIKDGQVFINGKAFEDPRHIYYYNAGEYGAVGQPIRVPQGKYFALGDNSRSSHNSRYWGFIDQYDLIGKAEFLFWPLDRIRFIH